MKKEGKWAITAAIAAGAGFATGILTAPRSGWRTRKKLAKSASKARIEAEKQLKQLHGDLQTLIKKGEAKARQSKSKANDELKKQLDNSRKTKQKVKMLISAIHAGEATDPDLKKVLEEAKNAKSNLSKFFKK